MGPFSVRVNCKGSTRRNLTVSKVMNDGVSYGVVWESTLSRRSKTLFFYVGGGDSALRRSGCSEALYIVFDMLIICGKKVGSIGSFVCDCLPIDCDILRHPNIMFGLCEYVECYNNIFGCVI